MRNKYLIALIILKEQARIIKLAAVEELTKIVISAD